ncbi:xylosidase/arabinosidase [Aspergillus rambellii]|uniref:Xylosidase/arabinosidase n=1 Tax=Aspergillus rambellii TaxID=308745 RepID=A0A0F8TY82_9EURO|nr:xylosidase/arabinosidase [Aspergillus rambellii]
MHPIFHLLFVLPSAAATSQLPLRGTTTTPKDGYAGNPVFPGWYADPEARIFNRQYWIYPTYSAAYEDQTFFDAFSSPDLLTWTKHPSVLNFSTIPWSTDRAAWAPSVARRRQRRRSTSPQNRGPTVPKHQEPGSTPTPTADEHEHEHDYDYDYDYFMYFSAGDGAGIGVAKSATGRPEGPFIDALGTPLVGETTISGAEPIDAQLFQDDDGRVWLYFGGWSHAVVVELNDDMVSLKGAYLEITPKDYVEGPWMLKRNGVYYFMYSVGGWGDNSYGVSYVTAASPTGPFSSTPTKILSGNDDVGTGTGHNSVFTPDGENYYIVYHRRYLNDTARDHRIVCIDRMEFDLDGNILPVNITIEGVKGRLLLP